MDISGKSRVKWIDLAKAAAILAVLTDHLFKTLYFRQDIWYGTFFSVSLFVLVLGVTSYLSLHSLNGRVTQWICKRSTAILGPYLLATAIYTLYYYRRLDLEIYLDKVIHFNASGPFYYVLLYLQMIIVAPLLCQIFVLATRKRYALLVEAAGLILVLAFSYCSMRYTNILSVYGAGKLFGGTYLVLFYLGMWFAKYLEKINLKHWMIAVLLMVGLLGAVLSWQFMINNNFALDRIVFPNGGINPPFISIIVYTLFVGMVIFALGNIQTKVLEVVSRLGKHTLHIFLWHFLIKELLDMIYLNAAGTVLEQRLIKMILYFVCMIAIPLCIEFVLRRIFAWVKKIYMN